MKRTIKLLIYALLISCIAVGIANAQMVTQNVQYTKVAMFSGKPIIQDTSLLIKNGTDTLRITTYADTTRFTTTAGGGFKFSPPLNVEATAWGLNGNAGASSSNFIGTTAGQDFVLKSNSREQLRLTADSSVMNTANYTQFLNPGGFDLLAPQGIGYSNIFSSPNDGAGLLLLRYTNIVDSFDRAVGLVIDARDSTLNYIIHNKLDFKFPLQQSNQAQVMIRGDSAAGHTHWQNITVAGAEMDSLGVVSFPSPGDGKTLVSDGSGTASWIAASGLNFATIPPYADNAAAFAAIGAGKLYYTDEAGEHIIKVSYTP